jgi:hypothetical protein
MTAQEHARQKERVAASARLLPAGTERHEQYARRNPR